VGRLLLEDMEALLGANDYKVICAMIEDWNKASMAFLSR
jgi:L-amino acid N-acyltransferase YncA